MRGMHPEILKDPGAFGLTGQSELPSRRSTSLNQSDRARRSASGLREVSARQGKSIGRMTEMKSTKIRAVLFDMDGVIVDSEFVYMDYLLDFARTKNPDVTMEQLNPMVGLSRKDSWTVMARAVNNGETWEQLKDQFSILDIYSQVDYKKIFRPEACDTAVELKKRGYLVALASSTGPKLIARIIEETGMRPVFDLIVSGKQFKQSKPNPEIYHYTAATLGVPDGECFVVEDSTVGIQAGKRAGMTVAALKDDRFGFDQSLADYRIDRISDILDYL